MSDYIKREDAIKAMARGIGIPYTDFIDVAERCMDDIPTGDVVEVVRCRDCKYATYDKSIDSYDCFWSGDHDQYTEANDFCSYGERADT
jgi:hypothetical protein